MVCQVSPLSSYSFSPFLYHTLWREVTIWKQDLKNVELISASGKTNLLHKLFAFHSALEMSSLICLFLCSTTYYISKYSWIFTFCSESECSTYLFCCSNCLGDLSVSSSYWKLSLLPHLLRPFLNQKNKTRKDKGEASYLWFGSVNTKVFEDK